MSQLVYAAGINSSPGALPATAYIGTPTIQPGDLIVVGAAPHGGNPAILGSAVGKVMTPNQWVWGSAGTALLDLIGSSKSHTLWWCTAPPTGTHRISMMPSATGNLFAQMAQFRPTPGYRFVYDPGLQQEYGGNINTGLGTITAVPNTAPAWGTGNLFVMSMVLNTEASGTLTPGVGSLIQGSAFDTNNKSAGQLNGAMTFGLGYSMNVPGTSGPYVLSSGVLTNTAGNSVGFSLVTWQPEFNEPVAGNIGDQMSMSRAVQTGSFW